MPMLCVATLEMNEENSLGIKGTIGLQAAVPKSPHTRRLTLTFYKSQPYERVESRLEPFHSITPCLFNIHVNLYCYSLYSLNGRDSSMNMVNTLLALLRYKRMNFWVTVSYVANEDTAVH